MFDSADFLLLLGDFWVADYSYQLYLLLGSVPYIFHVVNSVCHCVCVKQNQQRAIRFTSSFFVFKNNNIIAQTEHQWSLKYKFFIFQDRWQFLKNRKILKHNVAVKQSRPPLLLIHNHTCTHTHTHMHTHTQPHMHTHNHTHTHSAAPENKIHTSIMYTSTKMHAHITLSLSFSHTHTHTFNSPVSWKQACAPQSQAAFWSHSSVYRFTHFCLSFE